MSPAGSRQKVRWAGWLILTMLGLSMLLVVLGVYTATRAENLSVSGHVSGVIVSCISPPNCVASSGRTAGAEAGLSFISAVDLRLWVMTLLCCVALCAAHSWILPGSAGTLSGGKPSPAGQFCHCFLNHISQRRHLISMQQLKTSPSTVLNLCCSLSNVMGHLAIFFSLDFLARIYFLK